MERKFKIFTYTITFLVGVICGEIVSILALLFSRL